MPALIGLDKVHYALLSTDDNISGKATYGTPVRIMGAVSANINPNSSLETLFADNGPMESATSLGKIQLDLSVGDFPLDQQATLLGHAYVAGMMIRKGADIPPWLAIGGRALKSNGAYRYFWLVKGKMSEPEQKNETKKDKVNFSTPTMKGEFVKRDCDDIWIVEYDTDSVDYSPTVEATWFTKVMSLDDLPLGVVVTPADGATAVSTSVNLTAVFSKVITSGVAVTTNFVLSTVAAPGTPITCTVSLGTDNKTVTIDPTSALTAATQYQLVIKAATGLTDDKTIKFTTA